VEEYSTPPRHHNTPFSQARIKQNIMSSRLDKSEAVLSTIREHSQSPSPPHSDDNEDAISNSTTLPPGSPSRREDSSNVTIYPDPEKITAETLDEHMYTADNPPLDLFVRTSGVERLSDFMLWQCHQNTDIFFIDCFWPEFDLWHFLPVLVEWQWRQKQREREQMNENSRKRVKQS